MKPLALAVDPSVTPFPKGSSGSATDTGGGTFDDLIASLGADARVASDQASHGGGALNAPPLKYPVLQRASDTAGAAARQATDASTASPLDLGPLLAKVAATAGAGSVDPGSRDRVTRDAASHVPAPAGSTDPAIAGVVATVPPFPLVTSLEPGVSPESGNATTASSVTPVAGQGVSAPTPTPIDEDVPDATWTAPTLVSDIGVASHLAPSVPTLPSVAIPTPAVTPPDPTSPMAVAWAISDGATSGSGPQAAGVSSADAISLAPVVKAGTVQAGANNAFVSSMPSRSVDDANAIRASDAGNTFAAPAPVGSTGSTQVDLNDVSVPSTLARPVDDAPALRAFGAGSAPAVVEPVGAASSGAAGRIATPVPFAATLPGDTPVPAAQGLASGATLGVGDRASRVAPAAVSAVVSTRVGATGSGAPMSGGPSPQVAGPVSVAASAAVPASAERATDPSTPATGVGEAPNGIVTGPRSDDLVGAAATRPGGVPAPSPSKAAVSTPGAATDPLTIDASAGTAALIRGVADAIVRSATPAAATPAAAATPDLANPAALTTARTLTLQLNPGSLGTISVRLHLTGGALDVRLGASDPQTLVLLGRERDTLVAALRDQSTTLHALTIGGGDAPPPGGHDAPFQRAASDQASGNRSSGGAGTGQFGGQGDRPAPDRRPTGRSDALADVAPEPGNDLFV